MSLTDTFLRALYPEKCPLCRKILPFNQKHCPDCIDTEKRISQNFCEKCGAEREICICSDSSIYFSHFTAVFMYSGLARAKIHDFKFNNNIRLGKKLGDDMSFRVAEVFYDVNFDIVTFVPMTKSHEKERGFNQSEILAKQVAKRFSLPCCKLLTKVKETENQHTLDAQKRRTNLDGAFAVSDNADITGKTILLCDDIKTTGTTLKQCEKLLFEKGARDVYCISIAMTDYGDIFRPLDKHNQTY